MNTLHIGGMIFMITAWVFILALNVFCVYRILREDPKKITDTQDIESGLDKLDK